jgi:hypothetical protein
LQQVRRAEPGRQRTALTVIEPLMALMALMALEALNAGTGLR